MKIYAYIVAGLMLSGLLWYGHHIYVKADERDQFEEQAKAAEASKQRYADDALKAIQAFNAQREKDSAGDDALNTRLTALEGAAKALAQAARMQRPTVEKPDAQGVVRAVINPDWWLCQSATLSGDPTDATACTALGPSDGAVRP